ncbi:glycosyltransferase [Rubrobacter indicoceani]|uniref:glycosyltransferase n=1 Tax=Rubrobacter indicoceani TaxID=2051957 RepID=UPI000E5B0BB0|nr:glycosyltransferase [Rubrobacter indicoceani]
MIQRGTGKLAWMSYPGGENKPRLSVVIPTLNEDGYAGDLLRDLEGQTEPPDEIIVVDAGSSDGTAALVKGFAGARLLHGSRPVANGRNLGARAAQGEVLVFLDADVRIGEDFLERLADEFGRRNLDIACPAYRPDNSTRSVEVLHEVVNALIKNLQHILPSGSGAALVVRRSLFVEGRGFDPGLKFDDLEFVRRFARGKRFGVLAQEVRVSDRRYRKEGLAKPALRYSLLALLFALGLFRLANAIGYEFGQHEAPARDNPGE